MKTLPSRLQLGLAAAILVLFIFVAEATYARQPRLAAIGWSAYGPSAWFSSGSAGDEDPLRKPPTTLPRATLHLDGGNASATQVLAHAPGWTLFDRLYMLDGTLYIVSAGQDVLPPREHDALPPRDLMISKGIRIEPGAEAETARLPGDTEMKVISPKQAADLFEGRADWIEGVTWLVNDNKQFINHYYHFAAELLLGAWRAYSSLDPAIPDSGHTQLLPPARLLFPRLIDPPRAGNAPAPSDEDSGARWRDYAALNQLVLRAAFPSCAVETGQDWADRTALGRAFVFDRVLLADRSAAMRGAVFAATGRSAASAFALPGSAHFWAPVRNAVVELAAPPGAAPAFAYADSGARPVVTYVSRQDWGRRMLRAADHDALVSALNRLRDERGYEVHVVSMSKLSRIDQIALAARTTIMMGVHGNGLTALLWMPVAPRSAVFEFFFPGGFAHDYEWTARALGHAHVGFWGAESFTYPERKEVAYPDGFQGNDIPLDGPAVSRAVVERLEGRLKSSPPVADNTTETEEA